MSTRDDFIKSLRNFNNKTIRTIKGISNKFKGTFLNKKNILKASSIALATTAAIGLVGCTNSRYDNESKEPNNTIDSSILNDKHNNPNYLEKSEIYSKYSYIENRLNNNEKLTKQDILQLGNDYKKIISSIDYINSLDISTHVLNQLPNMVDLYGDMREDLIDLMVDKSVVLMPENSLDYQKRLIAEHYLINTDYHLLENINITKININQYCISSNKSDFCFEIYIYTGHDDSICIDPTSNIPNIEQISTQGISITDTNQMIPLFQDNLIENERER